jgi:hypothetical protein
MSALNAFAAHFSVHCFYVIIQNHSESILSLDSHPKVEAERSSMAMPTDQRSIDMPASRSGKNAITHHHGLVWFRLETKRYEDVLQK